LCPLLEPAKIRKNCCGLTILIVSLFSLCCLRITARVATLAVSKPDFEILAFLTSLAFFGNKKARRNRDFSGFFQPERLGSGKILSELRFHYISLLKRVYDHVGRTKFCKDFTVALKVIDVIYRKQMYDSVITGKKCF